jgi:hypothetical protein
VERTRSVAYRLEPPLATPVTVGADVGPGGLLDARNEVVPFHGRVPELAELARWRDGGPELATVLVHGAAGVGKTRLCAKFASDSQAEGWTVLLARYGEEPAAAEQDEGGRGLLLVVDDAERWPWHDLYTLLQEPLQRAPGKTRVLLAARFSGWWWSSTRQRGSDLDHVMSDLPLEVRPAEHADSFALACRHFADTLGVERPDVPAPNAESLFDLHLAALAVVHGAEPDADHADLVRHLMSRDPAPAGCGRLAEDFLAVTLLDRRIAPETTEPGLAVLVRAARRWPHLLARTEELFTANPDLASAVGASTLAELAEIADIAPLQAIARHVFDEPRFNYDALPAVLTRRLVEHGVARSIDKLEQAELHGMLAARAALAALREEALAAAHREVALYRELAEIDPAEHRPALADSLGDLGLRFIAAHRPDDALRASEEAVALCKEIAAADPDCLPQLAGALEQLALRYAALGRRDDAMTAISKAALMFQELAKMSPALFRLDFAKVSHHLAVRLFDVGRREEAGHAAQWALVHWREAADADPRYEPDFARTLTKIGKLLGDFGMKAESVVVVEESITVLRRLAAANPRVFEPELAMALADFACLLVEVDRGPEAVKVSGESVAMRRRLAESEEPADRAALATALGTHVEVLAKSGEVEDRLSAAKEAVRLWRPLATEHPISHLIDLAVAMATLADLLLSAQREYEAHLRVQEILQITRRLPHQLLVVHGNGLALALLELSSALSQVDHHSQAVELAEQVVSVWRDLVGHSRIAPVAHVLALHQLGVNLRRARQHDASRGVAHTAVVLWHVARTPEQLGSDVRYADALSFYGRLCAEAGVALDEALDATHRAVLVIRKAHGSPEHLSRALDAVKAVLDAHPNRLAAQERLQLMVDRDWEVSPS